MRLVTVTAVFGLLLPSQRQSNSLTTPSVPQEQLANLQLLTCCPGSLVPTTPNLTTHVGVLRRLRRSFRRLLAQRLNFWWNIHLNRREEK